MKKIIGGICVVLMIAGAILAFYAKPLVLDLTLKAVKKSSGADVSIGDADVRLLSGISFFDVNIRKGDIYNIQIKAINTHYTLLSLLQRRLHGDLVIEKFQYNKFKFTDIHADLRLQGEDLFFEHVKGGMLGGSVQGHACLKLVDPLQYSSNLVFTGLDLAAVVQDFALKEKVEMTGLVAGRLDVNGKTTHFDMVSGDLSAGEQGGRLIIKDTRFLENMAQNAKIPPDIMVDSFKDYHYNTGAMKVYLQEKDLMLDVSLQGEAGKRDLKIALHDFTLK